MNNIISFCVVMVGLFLLLISGLLIPCFLCMLLLGLIGEVVVGFSKTNKKCNVDKS